MAAFAQQFFQTGAPGFRRVAIDEGIITNMASNDLAIGTVGGNNAGWPSFDPANRIEPRLDTALIIGNDISLLIIGRTSEPFGPVTNCGDHQTAGNFKKLTCALSTAINQLCPFATQALNALITEHLDGGGEKLEMQTFWFGIRFKRGEFPQRFEIAFTHPALARHVGRQRRFAVIR